MASVLLPWRASSDRLLAEIHPKVLSTLKNMSESEHLSIHSIMENREQGYINAINILGKLRFEKSVNELIHLISDYDQSPESEIATTEAINALIDIGEPSVIPLTKAINSTYSNIRFLIVNALGQIGDKRAVDTLISVLNDTDITVCQYAALALGKLGDKKALKPIVSLLNTNNEYLKASVNYALSMLTTNDLT